MNRKFIYISRRKFTTKYLMLGLKMPLIKNNYSKTVNFISELDTIFYIYGIVHHEHTKKKKDGFSNIQPKQKPTHKCNTFCQV